MLTAEPQKDAAAKVDNAAFAAALTPFEAEVIGLFVQLSQALGQPRSLAELYGLLFISARPLAMDDLMERLGLSKGSASQGLRFLRNAGAIKMVYVAGDRRVHYEAVAELRNLATRFLRDQIIPQLDTGLKRIEDIAAMLKQLPADKRAQVSSRVTMLQSWGKKSRKVLPIIVKLMGG
jgi:HTH-type transcriptional regulator, glycine betaine synthesis regulator